MGRDVCEGTEGIRGRFDKRKALLDTDLHRGLFSVINMARSLSSATYCNKSMRIVLFCGICNSSSLVNGAMRMLVRRINGIQLDRFFARIGQVMPFPSGDRKSIAVANAGLKIQLVFCIAHLDDSLSIFNTNELIQVRVHFQSYIPSDVYAHQGKL